MPTKAQLEQQLLELQKELAETRRKLRQAQDFITGQTGLDDPEALRDQVELFKEEDDVPF